jgi:hypothetical protein
VTVAVIAGHAQISVAAARQALIAHEKAGTAVRVKGGDCMSVLLLVSLGAQG